jgi:hypothetical protein
MTTTVHALQSQTFLCRPPDGKAGAMLMVVVVVAAAAATTTAAAVVVVVVVVVVDIVIQIAGARIAIIRQK